MTKTDDEAVKLGEPCVASFGFELLKAEESGDGKTGRVTALVSAYKVEYRMGGWSIPIMHYIHDGAFKGSVESQAAIPIFWQHNWDWSEQPPIGTGTAAEEERGLIVTADFFLDTEAGRSVFNAIKAKALREWSIGYRIIRYEVEDTDQSKKVIHIKEAELLEASSVLRGANPETDTLLVARQMPAEIQEALDTITEFMQAQKAVNEEVTQLKRIVTSAVDEFNVRIDALEVSHDILVDSMDVKPSSVEGKDVGSEVEPAVGGSEGPDGAGSTPDGQAPSSADGVAAEGQVEGTPPAPSPDTPLDLDAMLEKVTSRVIARLEAEVNDKKQEIVDRAGRLLPGGDNEDAKDLDSLTRVLRVQNKVQHLWESTERRAEAGVLANSSREMPMEEV